MVLISLCETLMGERTSLWSLLEGDDQPGNQMQALEPPIGASKRSNLTRIGSILDIYSGQNPRPSIWSFAFAKAKRKAMTQDVVLFGV